LFPLLFNSIEAPGRNCQVEGLAAPKLRGET